MEKWENFKEILFDLLTWATGIIVLCMYGYEIGKFVGKAADKLEKYYKILLVLAGVDFIWVFVGILLKWPAFIGIGFIASVIIFAFSWTPVALALVGIDKATKHSLGNLKLFPPVFGTIVFWLCSVGLAATLHPEILGWLFFVISILVICVFLALWHSLGLKTHFQEWAMLTLIILMVVVYAAKNTFPRFYDTLSRNVISRGQSFHDQLQTGTPTDLADSLYDVKHENALLLKKSLKDELDVMKKQIKNGTPLTPTQMKRWEEIEIKEFPRIQKEIAGAKLSPTSGTTTASGSSGIALSSGGGGINKNILVPLLIVVLGIIGACFKETRGAAIVIASIGLVLWFWFGAKSPSQPRPTPEEREYQQVTIADSPKSGSVCITAVDVPGVFFWRRGNDLGPEVKVGDSSKRLDSRLKLWVHKDNLTKIGGIRSDGMVGGIHCISVD